MKIKQTEKQPVVKKRFFTKTFIVFLLAVVSAVLSMFCYRQYNLSKDPYLKNDVKNGFYTGSITNMENYSFIRITGIDTEKRSYNIDIDCVTGVWNGDVSYVIADDSSVVVTEPLSGVFTKGELMSLISYINKIDEDIIIRVDSNGDNVALVREAALADNVKDSFEDFMGFFYQSKLSLDEYMAQ